ASVLNSRRRWFSSWHWQKTSPVRSLLGFSAGKRSVHPRARGIFGSAGRGAVGAPVSSSTKGSLLTARADCLGAIKKGTSRLSGTALELDSSSSSLEPLPIGVNGRQPSARAVSCPGVPDSCPPPQ